MRKLQLLLLAAALAASMPASGAPAAPPDPAPPAAEAGAPAPGPAAAADGPVSLADAQAFEARPAPEVGQDEIAEARRALASAVSAEKFMDGAEAVLVAYLLYLVVF